jgi:Holliday junction DNA helicase RuvA
VISDLIGTVLYKDGNTCTLNVHGIGFLVEVSRMTHEQLPGIGHEVHLYTHLAVREDNWRLVGFATADERQIFLDLLSVGGLGIKGALSVLGALGIDGLESAVFNGDWERIKQAPGVGTKLAQRIQLELSGQWENRPRKQSTQPASDTPRTEDDVVGGLMALGYSREEAESAARQVPAEGDLASRIRQALRTLDRH